MAGAGRLTRREAAVRRAEGTGAGAAAGESFAAWNDGFTVAGTGLWLDPRGSAEFGFASDALGESRAARVVAAAETVEFLKARRPWPAYLPSPYHRTFTVGDADVELVPSGVHPGAAQLLLRRRGVTALYFRRILPEPVGLGPPVETPAADLALVDAPGGFSGRACAQRAKTLDGLAAWVERVVAAGEIPAVMAERQAAVPAVVARLAPLGCELRLQRAAYAVVRLCLRAGLVVERAWEIRGAPRVGQVFIFPFPYGRPEAVAAIPRVRVAVVHDGTAEIPPELMPDEVFPAAFAAGVTEIAAHVHRSGASAALLSPQTPPAVAGILHDLGVTQVRRVGPPEQLPLSGIDG